MRVGGVGPGDGPQRASAMLARRSGSASSASSSAASRSAVSSASGTTTAPPASASSAGVAGLVVAGDVRRRHEHRRQADGGDLEAHRRARPEHADVGGGERPRHVVLVADLLVAGTASGRRTSSQSRSPTTWRTATSSRSRQRSASSTTARLIDSAPRLPPATSTRQRPAATPRAPLGRGPVARRGRRRATSGADRVAGDDGARAAACPGTTPPTPWRSGRPAGWPRRGACSARRRRSAPATAPPPARTAPTRSRRRRRRPRGRRRRTRPTAGHTARRMPSTAPTLASVSRRAMPRPGSSVTGMPVGGTSRASRPRSAPT